MQANISFWICQMAIIKFMLLWNFLQFMLYTKESKSLKSKSFVTIRDF